MNLKNKIAHHLISKKGFIQEYQRNYKSGHSNYGKLQASLKNKGRRTWEGLFSRKVHCSRARVRDFGDFSLAGLLLNKEKESSFFLGYVK